MNYLIFPILPGSIRAAYTNTPYQRRNDVQDIKRVVMEEYNKYLDLDHDLTWYDINKVSRNRELVEARQWIMYIASKRTDLTLKAIAKIFIREYDHSTVINARNKIGGMVSVDKKMRALHDKISERLDYLI